MEEGGRRSGVRESGGERQSECAAGAGAGCGGRGLERARVAAGGTFSREATAVAGTADAKRKVERGL